MYKSIKIYLIFVCMIGLGQMALGQDRHFGWTYESVTLPKGAIDIEPWFTYSSGRENFYNRYSSRLEFEFGLTDRLQTAFYFNSKHQAAATTDTTGNITGIEKKSSFSLSNEWKLNLLNPSTKAIGLALYGEYTLYPHEIELEYKILIDKKTEKNIFAFNHVGEFEYEYEFEMEDNGEGKIEIEKVLIFEHDLGFMHLFKSNFGLGLELRNHNEIVKSELEHAVLFGGPSLFYSHSNENGHGFFLIFSPLWQFTNFAGEDAGKPNLKEHEKMEARVLLGFSL